MSDRPQPAFQAREGYRNRRLADIARLLPVGGLILFMLPLLWTGPGEMGRTGYAGIFIFLVWLLLILLTGLMSGRLSRLNEAEAEEQGQGTDGSL